MCATCGCGSEGTIDDSMADHGHSHGEPHDHAHRHEHGHAHEHEHSPSHDTAHDHYHPHDPARAHAHSSTRAPEATQRGTSGSSSSETSSQERRRMPLTTFVLARPRSSEHQDRERIVMLEQQVLAKNNYLAQENRQWFEERKILTLNLLSSPGAGKTTLLEATIRALRPELTLSVIEGDQETSLDAARIAATGSPAIQVNTGSGCHLDAAMISRCLPSLAPPRRSVVLIENVGNLVCPALFDLGERAKVVVVSATEGDDKPLKYPHIFRASELLLINKIDLLPHVRFDVDRCIEHARSVKPRIQVIQLSATRGDGLQEWFDWIRARHASMQTVQASSPA